jgi:hypothetical protein
MSLSPNNSTEVTGFWIMVLEVGNYRGTALGSVQGLCKTSLHEDMQKDKGQ